MLPFYSTRTDRGPMGKGQSRGSWEEEEARLEKRLVRVLWGRFFSQLISFY